MWFGGRLTRGGGGWQGGRSSSVPVARFLARPAPRVIRRAKVVPCLSNQTSVFTGLWDISEIWKSKVSERKGNEPNGDGGKLVLAGLEFWMAAALESSKINFSHFFPPLTPKKRLATREPFGRTRYIFRRKSKLCKSQTKRTLPDSLFGTRKTGAGEFTFFGN